MSNFDECRDEFLDACKTGDFKKAKNISETCDGYVQFRCPDTLEKGLHKCARNSGQESIKIVEYILKQDIKLNSGVSRKNCTPLTLATHFQIKAIGKALLTSKQHTLCATGLFTNWTTANEIRINDTEVYPPFSTSLHIAILLGNIKIIGMLLRYFGRL